MKIFKNADLNNYALQKCVNLLLFLEKQETVFYYNTGFICTQGKICKVESHCIGRN